MTVLEKHIGEYLFMAASGLAAATKTTDTYNYHVAMQKAAQYARDAEMYCRMAMAQHDAEKAKGDLHGRV